MIDDLAAAVEHWDREGARRFSRWDGALYRALVDGPGQVLFAKMQSSARPSGAPIVEAGDDNAALVFSAWVRLLVEAIGYGYVDAQSLGDEARPPENLVALVLLRKAPALLPHAPARERVALLARAFNLGEGLLGEAPWLNACVTAALSNIESLADLDKKLLRVLEAALVPATRARLAGPFSVRTVDTREVDHAFLPGAMHFSAPALVCVHDRKRPGMHAGLLLGPGGTSTLMGPGPCLGRPPHDGQDLPTITMIQGGLHVGEAKLLLSQFKRGHSAAASRAGFLVVSALDSQRLWVAESP